MPPKILKSAAEIVKDAIKTVEAEKKAKGGSIDLEAEYQMCRAGGGFVRKAMKAIQKAAESADVKMTPAIKDLTTMEDAHTGLMDSVREKSGQMRKVMEGLEYKYKPGEHVFTESKSKKPLPPWKIVDRQLSGNMVMREPVPPGTPALMGKIVRDPETGKPLRTPYEPGYKVRREYGPDDWEETIIPESGILGRLDPDEPYAKGGIIKSLAKAIAKELPEAKASQKTQIRGTEPTYRKAYEILEREKPGGRTLDYGAGLGHGSRLMGAESFEPFPREGFKPDFIRPEDIPTEEFDRLVNLNVLNVMPREMRDATVENIGRVMRPGGMGIVTTRGRDVLNAAGEAGPEPMSKITSIGTYQKGFTPEELREYLEYILGRDYSVSKLGLGPAGATIKKKANGGPVKMADGGGLEEEYNLRKMGMDPTRVRGGYERKPLSREEIQAMMLDVPAGIGVPFAEAGSYALRGKTDEAKESAAIEAALIGVPGAAVLAKPAYQAVKKGVKKAAPAARDLAREFLESGMESGAILDPRMQAIAYHGTPHKFEKFDASKIGTGEGAQAYGHGLYFAEAKPTAEGYATNLANRDASNQMRLNAHANAQRLANLAGPENAADDIKYALSVDPNHPQKKLLSETLELLESGRYELPLEFKGHLYTVDIPDESVARMLDWDKPLSEQPEAVQKALSKADIAGNASYFVQNPNEGTLGEMYRSLANQHGAPTVSEFLKSQGIPGIKYFDANSRANFRVQNTYKGEPYGDPVPFMTEKQALDYAKEQEEKGFGAKLILGTRNFVVFPGEEETVKILERKKHGGSIKSGADSMNLERQFQNAMMGLKSPLKGDRRYAEGGSVQVKSFNGLPLNMNALDAERRKIMQEYGVNDFKWLGNVYNINERTTNVEDLRDAKLRLIRAAGYTPEEVRKLDNVDKMIASVITQNRTPEMDQALRQIVANEQKYQEALRSASEANKLKDDKTIDPQVLQREQAKAKLGVMQSAADLNKSMGAFFGTDTFDQIEPSSQYRLDRDEMNLLGVQKDPVTQEYVPQRMATRTQSNASAQSGTQTKLFNGAPFNAEAFEAERQAVMREYGLDLDLLAAAYGGSYQRAGLNKGQSDEIRARLDRAAGYTPEELNALPNIRAILGTAVVTGGEAEANQIRDRIAREQTQYQEALNWMKPVGERRQELIDYLEGRSPSFGGTPGMSEAELESRYLSNLRQNPERLQEFLADAKRLQDARERDPELSEKEQAGKKLFAFQRAVDLNSTLASVGSNERVEPPRLTAREMQLLGIKENPAGTGYATPDNRWYGEDRPLDFLTRSNNIYNSIFGNTLVNPDAYRDVMQEPSTQGPEMGELPVEELPVWQVPGMGELPVWQGPGTDFASDDVSIQVIVYGPDGTMYSSPAAAQRAGVFNYTMTPPAKAPGNIQAGSGLITNQGPGMGLAPNLSTGMKGGTPPTSSGLITNQGPGMGLASGAIHSGGMGIPSPVAPPAPRLNINPVVTPTIQTGTMTPTAMPQIDVQKIGRNLGAIPMRSGGAAIMKDGGRIKPDYKAALDMLFYQMRNKG